MPNKTKSEEMAILAAAVRELGPDSYCGPWLSAALPAINMDMLGDLEPSPTWGALRDEREAVKVELAAVKVARDEADQDRRQAAYDKAKATKALDDARDMVQGLLFNINKAGR